MTKFLIEPLTNLEFANSNWDFPNSNLELKINKIIRKSIL